MKFIRSITVLGMDSTDLKALIEAGKLVPRTNVADDDGSQPSAPVTRQPPKAKRKRKRALK